MQNIDLFQLLTNISVMLGGGIGLWACVNLAKRLEPWLKGHTTILRFGGMALAAVSVFVSKAATGALEGADLQLLGVSLLEAATVWLTAHATHKALKKE